MIKRATNRKKRGEMLLETGGGRGRKKKKKKKQVPRGRYRGEKAQLKTAKQDAAAPRAAVAALQQPPSPERLKPHGWLGLTRRKGGGERKRKKRKRRFVMTELPGTPQHCLLCHAVVLLPWGQTEPGSIYMQLQLCPPEPLQQTS